MLFNRLFLAGPAAAPFDHARSVSSKPTAPKAPADSSSWLLLQLFDKTSLLFSRGITTWAMGKRDFS